MNAAPRRLSTAVALELAVGGELATLNELMDAAVEQIGDREAYVEVQTGQRLTFAEWLARADAVAAHLASLGVAPGDVVAVALPPSIDYAVACTAAVRLGAVVTGINTRLGPREVAAIFERCQPVAVVHDDGFVVPRPTGVVLDRLQLCDASTSGARPPRPVGLLPSDPAVIIWTSGTTGLPKGAWFDHRNLAAAVQTAGEMTRPYDRRISGIPMAHAGYMAKLWEQWAFAVTIVLSPTPWTAASMLQVLVQERITVGAGVPTQWAKLVELPEMAWADLSALRLCLSATAPCPPELVARIHELMRCPVVVRYAMTESPSITGTSGDDPVEVQHHTVGRPQDGVTVEVVDEHGIEVSRGEVGRVRVTGPCVMRGYWCDPVHTDEVIDEHGRLMSSDLGRLDDAGNLVLVGRASDMYIRGGYNVYPLEVEHVLAEHPGVDAVAVVGAGRPVIGEIGVAFVVAASDHPVDLASLRAFVIARLADYKAPDELRVVDALPLTAMLKVDKDALRASLTRR